MRKMLASLILLWSISLGAQSPPAQAAAYKLVWMDDFSTLSLCTSSIAGCKWYNWDLSGGPITDQSGSYTNLQWATAQGGHYTIMTTAATNGAYLTSFSPPVYIEISMKFDAVTGQWPALWLRSNNSIGTSPFSGGELDMFEWQSDTPTKFYGTVHSWASGVDTAIGISPTMSGITLTNYNTYGILWTQTGVSWYLNNTLLGTQSVTGAPYNALYAGQQPFFLMMSIQPGCNWTYPCAGAISPTNMQVQWVHVFQPPAVQMMGASLSGGSTS